MRILLCNDDGIYAEGIERLYHAVRHLGEIAVVAPEAERSAVGHAITIASPIKSRRIERSSSFSGYAVSGTPADCVKLAIGNLMPEPPDLVLSGINHGANAGISILYSGTVSGATEGAICGVPSVALSMATFDRPLWETGARVATQVVEMLQRNRLPPATVLNVNIPNRPFKELLGYAVVPMGPSRWVEEFDERIDPRGNTYYWIDGKLQLSDGAPHQNDVTLVDEGYVTITPITFDLTAHTHIEPIRAWDWKL